MNAIDWLGMLAGMLSTAAFAPQALLIWRQRSAAGDDSYAQGASI